MFRTSFHALHFPNLLLTALYLYGMFIFYTTWVSCVLHFTNLTETLFPCEDIILVTAFVAAFAVLPLKGSSSLGLYHPCDCITLACISLRFSLAAAVALVSLYELSYRAVHGCTSLRSSLLWSHRPCDGIALDCTRLGFIACRCGSTFRRFIVLVTASLFWQHRAGLYPSLVLNCHCGWIFLRFGIQSLGHNSFLQLLK